jgi:hypothetical protein
VFLFLLTDVAYNKLAIFAGRKYNSFSCRADPKVSLGPLVLCFSHGDAKPGSSGNPMARAFVSLYPDSCAVRASPMAKRKATHQLRAIPVWPLLEPPELNMGAEIKKNVL